MLKKKQSTDPNQWPFLATTRLLMEGALLPVYQLTGASASKAAMEYNVNQQ